MILAMFSHDQIGEKNDNFDSKYIQFHMYVFIYTQK
jgi:hypothetical protein